jgi:D-alanyl-D-alanine carboxypeptidase
MKTIFIFLFFISSVASAYSQGLTDEFKTLVSQHKIGEVKEQAYCYLENGSVKGYQSQKLQRIASLTKLLSTLLASETSDLHRSFKTKIYIGKDSLHIEGGKDPYFEEEKLFLLMETLNQLGHRSFKRVTFNRNFLFYDIALGEYDYITPEKMRTRLAYYLNPKNLSAVRAKWASIRKFSREEGVVLESKVPFVSASQVLVSDKNPVLNENPQIFTHVSFPFHRILKTMNVQSKNLVAENVYTAGIAIKPLVPFLINNDIPAVTMKIYNGSGLPIVHGKNRQDNLATCESMLKIISLLRKSLKRHNLELSDVLAVNGGQDLGSFRDRFKNYPDTHEAVISKTGTLKQTSSLAGVLMTTNARPFVILNHTLNASAARKFQDKFVSRMFDYLGPATPISYSKISIFPWDETDFLNQVY